MPAYTRQRQRAERRTLVAAAHQQHVSLKTRASWLCVCVCAPLPSRRRALATRGKTRTRRGRQWRREEGADGGGETRRAREKRRRRRRYVEAAARYSAAFLSPQPLALASYIHSLIYIALSLQRRGVGGGIGQAVI